MYSATEFAFEPGALANSMPRAARYPTSTWSQPIVAVPTNLTGEPERSASSTRVTDRTIRTSTSFEIGGGDATAGKGSHGADDGRRLEGVGNVLVDENLHERSKEDGN